jgi:hypothetical protein
MTKRRPSARRETGRALRRDPRRVSGHQLPPCVSPHEHVGETIPMRDGLTIGAAGRDRVSSAEHSERSVEQNARLVNRLSVAASMAILLTSQIIGSRRHRPVSASENEFVSLDASKIGIVAISIGSADVILNL